MARISVSEDYAACIKHAEKKPCITKAFYAIFFSIYKPFLASVALSLMQKRVLKIAIGSIGGRDKTLYIHLYLINSF